jgi:hypothetical protein
MICQVRSCYVFMLRYERLDHAMAEYIILGLVTSGLVKLGQFRTVFASLGEVLSG